MLFVSSIQPTLAAYNPSGWVNYGGSTNADVTAAVATPTTLATTVVTTTTVTLTWVDNSSNETSYRIERAPDSSGTPGTFAEVGSTAANATSYTDTGLTASTIYWYRIRAYSGSTYSTYTTNLSTTTAVATLLPNTTTNIAYQGTPVTPTSTTLSTFTTTAFTAGNNTSVGTADASTLATTASGTTGSGAASIPFTTSGNYSLQNAAAQVSGGVASLTGTTGSSPVNYSARFNGTNGYLSRTPSVAGNQKTWTFSTWVKRGKLGTNARALFAAGSGADQTELYFNTDDTLKTGICVTGVGCRTASTNAVYRDPSMWYHVVWSVDAINTIQRIYVNGTEVSYATHANPTNANMATNNTVLQYVGTSVGNEYFDGYLADSYLIDGQVLDPTYFAQTDSNGTWVPKSYSGTYGTNGFHLTFANSSAMGTDSSGNGNTWTANNIATTDQMLDTPTDNAVTWDVLDRYASLATFSKGNTQATKTGGGSTLHPTLFAASGKYYYEIQAVSGYTGESSAGMLIGVTQPRAESDANGFKITYLNSLGNLYVDSVLSSSGWTSATADGDILMCAFDVDTGKVWFGRNGTWLHSGDPANGTAPAGTSTLTKMGPVSGVGSSSGTGWTPRLIANRFTYSAPSGFKALSTANLPTPTITKPNQYFDVKLWTGTGVQQNITGLQFQPDFVWIKDRNGGITHAMFDVVRGAGVRVSSDRASSEGNTGTDQLVSFNSDGFTLGPNNTTWGTNRSGITHVGWNWKAGGAGVSNTAGTVTTTVSANPTAGFAIVNGTLPGSASRTLGHGLGATPAFIMARYRNNSTDWNAYHQSLGITKYLYLNKTSIPNTDANMWGAVGTSTFTMGSSWGLNDAAIAYVWSEVPGFSKFGSYTGNASTDGPFVYTGFKPRYIMIKRTDATSNWRIWDTARNIYNSADLNLWANDPGVEGSGNDVDVLSNGFKQRQTWPDQNASGGTYIYAAFADTPLQPANYTTYTANAMTLVTTAADQLSTSTWSGITSVAVTETKPTNTSIYYATSFDGRTTFSVNTTGAWRSVARNNSGTWQYNSNTTYGSTTWAACTTNTQDACLSQAFGVTANQMTGTQLQSITTGNWSATGGWTSGNTIDIATGLLTTDATATPSVDNIQFTYSTAPRYAAHLFTYNTSAYAVTSLAPSLLAYATANAGNGITTKIWNANTLAWDALTSLNNTSATLPTSTASQTISASVSNYIDGSGIVRVLTYSNNPSTGATSAVLTTDYAALSLWGTMINASPNTPTLVSPSNAGYVASNQPTVSATYSDPDANDTGTTEYRIATGSAGNCTSNTSVVASGISSATSATAANVTSTTTWTPGSSIGADGVYYWCARNNDSVATSAWTSMGSFTLDTAAPATPTISYTNAYLNSTSQSVTFSSTDGGSGIASYTLYRNAGTLNAGSCSSYAGWVSLGTQTSPYTDSTLQSAKCYQYYVTATDNATNATSSTTSPASTTKVDTQNPNSGAAPTVTDSDSLSATWTNALTVAIGAFASSDTLSGIWKYLINESSTTPLSGDANWVTTAPATYILGNATNGAKTIYFWVMDLAGNISSYVSAGISLDTVAPSGTSIAINSAAAYTTSSTLTLTLSASDPGGSGVTQMQFSCNNSAYTTAEAYATSKSFALGSYAAVGCTTTDGAKTVYVQYMDAAGNTSTQVHSSITLDTTVPGITVTDNANANWNMSDTVIATLTEANPQTLKWDYDADGVCPTLAGSYANTYTSGNTLTVNTTHTDYICFLAIDAAGNTTAVGTNVLKVDLVAPTTSGAITGGTLGSNSWYTTNVIYTLTPADATSGVASTVYCTDTANSCTPATSGTSITVTANSATNYVRWSSTDNAGNVQAVQSSGAIKIDTVVPTSPAISWTTPSATVTPTLTLSATDVTAGVASMQFSCDNSTWSASVAYATSYSSFNINTGAGCTVSDGATTIYVRYLDAAGNVSASSNQTGALDTTAPTTSGSITGGALGNNSWYTTNVTYTLTPADATTSVTATVYCVDTANSCTPATSGTSATVSTESATNYVRWASTDAVGNVQATQSSGAIKLDKTNPSVTAAAVTSPNGSESWGGNTSHAITWNTGAITDGLSGFGSITIAYTTDGTNYTTIATGLTNTGSYTWTTPDITSASVRVRLTAYDAAGNSSTDSSDANFTLTSTSTATRVTQMAGSDNQLVGMNTLAANEIGVTVDNGFGIPVAGTTVTFTIVTVPTTPTAVGQALGNGTYGSVFGGTSTVKTVTSDASGRASATFASGNRAGAYVITAIIGDGSGSQTATFTVTEREIFEVTLGTTSASIGVDPSATATNVGTSTVTVTTNAASWSLVATPATLPTSGAANTIASFANSLGFGWKIDAGSVAAFLGGATPTATTVYTCATGDATCHAANGITTKILGLSTTVNYLTPAGTYSNANTVTGSGVTF